MSLVIRNENKNDYRIVEELTREAFWNLHHLGCDEHYILHNLRNSTDFIRELTFVAQNDGQIIGHIAYSRGLVIDKQGTQNEIISFGPISVLPENQKHHKVSGMAYTVSLMCLQNTIRLLLPFLEPEA